MSLTFNRARYENGNVFVTASDGREFIVSDKVGQIPRGGIGLTPLDWENPGPKEPLALRAEFNYPPQELDYGTSDLGICALAIIPVSRMDVEEGPLDIPPRAAAEKIVKGFVREWIDRNNLG